MTTLKLCPRFLTLFIITCCRCCYGMMITSPPPVQSVNKTDVLFNHSIEIIFNNKTALPHESVKLMCEIKPKTTTVLGTVWMKGSTILSESQRVKFEDQKVIIKQTNENDTGYYTCSVKTHFGSLNKTAYLTVIETEEENDESEEQEKNGDSSGDGELRPTIADSPCGRPEKELFSECKPSYPFINCKSLAPRANLRDINIKQTANTSSKAPTLRIKIQWKVPKAGNTDIWGWQITVADVGMQPGVYRCVQINKKFLWEEENGDYYANYTFTEFMFGTRLKLVIQSLPAESKESAVTKIFSTRDLGDCELFPDQPCCYKVRNVSVKEYDDTSAILSWPELTNSSINSTLISGFVVNYNSTSMKDPCHNGIIVSSLQDALQKSHILVQDLRPFCQNYSFQVTPLFTVYGCTKECSQKCDQSSKGIRSKLYFYRMTILQASSHPKSEHQPHLLKAVVAVVVVLTAALVLSMVIFVMRKRPVEEAKKSVTVTGRPVTEVFIAHGSHCKDCEDAVLSVATYLNATGYCECFLDMCALPTEWSPGTTQYYENKFAKCQKVIVMFTVNEKDKCMESRKSRDFIYQENLIRSELISNCSTTKFIPVYMDFLSDLDIPSFLRNKKSFSLPSQLTELVLYIIGEPVCKPVSVCPMLALEEDSNLMKHKKIMESKIKELNGKHQKKLKIKNNNSIAKVV